MEGVQSTVTKQADSVMQAEDCRGEFDDGTGGEEMKGVQFAAMQQLGARMPLEKAGALHTKINFNS